MIEIWSKVYDGLKTYLAENCQYNPYVCRIPPQKKTFPIVVVTEITNQTSSVATAGIEGVDTLGYQIDEYIAPKNATEEKIFAQDTEISQLVDKYMLANGFQRLSSEPTPNIDSTIFRRTSRYTANAATRTGKIFR